MLLTCDDTFHLICSVIQDVRSLGLLCRTDKRIRMYLNSPDGGVHWTRVAKLVCGLKYWQPLPDNHPRADNAKYVAQIRMCPWTSFPQVLPIRFMDRIKKRGCTKVVIGDMDCDLDNAQNPMIVGLKNPNGSKTFPNEEYWVSISLRPWSVRVPDKMVKRMREDCTRDKADETLTEIYKTDVLQECAYYANMSWHTVFRVHEGLCAVQVGCDSNLNKIMFYATKDMRLLGCLSESTSHLFGAIVFGCGEFWMVDEEKRYILYYGASVNNSGFAPRELDYKDRAFVMFRNGHFQQAVDYARKIGYDLNSMFCSVNETTLLHHAVEMNSAAAIRFLVLENGMSPNVTDETGTTPIIHAAYHGNPDMIPVLVEVGGNVNFVRPNGWDTLFFVEDGPPEPRVFLAEYVGAMSCLESVVRILLDNGANVNWTSAKGYTPLWGACRVRRQLPVIRMLLAAGADVNARSADGYALFSRLIVDGVAWGGSPQIHTIFPLLYEFGCDVNAESGPHNRTALMEAVARDKQECAQALMFM